MRQNRWLDILIALLIVIAALYLVQLLWHIGLQFAHVLLLFFVAWVVAFLLTPLVEVLHRLWLPRAIAVTLIYLLLGGLITVLVLLALRGRGGARERAGRPVPNLYRPGAKLD